MATSTTLWRRAAVAGAVGASLALTGLLVVLCGVVPPLLDPSARRDTPAHMPSLILTFLACCAMAILAFVVDTWYAWRAKRQAARERALEPAVTVSVTIPAKHLLVTRHTHVCDCGTIIFCPRVPCAYEADYRCATCELDARDRASVEPHGSRF